MPHTMNRYVKLLPLLAPAFYGCANVNDIGSQTPPQAEITIIKAASAPVAAPPVAAIPILAKKPQARPVNDLTRITRLIAPKTADREGWSKDILTAFVMLKIPATRENICSAIAVIEQESSFQSDPPVPNLPAIAWSEIEKRREKYAIPKAILGIALDKASPDGRSYKNRIDSLKTEKDMNELFEDMITELPGGQNWLAGFNPIRTGGPMQVSIEFAEAHARVKPYPYSRPKTLRDAVFTRPGGVYFGIADLLDYPAPYTDPVFRFADYNSGHFSSRNAAFQSAVAKISGRKLALDGDLLNYKNGQAEAGETEKALLSIIPRLKLPAEVIRRDLLQEKTSNFAATQLYQRVFALAPGNAPRVLLPKIDLNSPKIQRHLTTEWFAQRVSTRYRQCLAR